MITGIRLSRRQSRLAASLIVAGMVALTAACTREQAARFLRELPAAQPKADVSITPSLYCPGETLRFAWDAGPQFTDCVVQPYFDPYTREQSLVNVGPGICKVTTMVKYGTYPFPGWENSLVSLTGSMDAVEPSVALGNRSEGVSLQFEAFWDGWNWPWPNQWSWGSQYLTYNRGSLNGGLRSGHRVVGYASARLIGSGLFTEGNTRQDRIVVQGRRFCNQETHQWEYLPGTETRYRRQECRPDGSCGLMADIVLTNSISETLSACTTLMGVCSGGLGSYGFNAPGYGLNTTLAPFECSQDLTSIGISLLDIDQGLDITPGSDWSSLQGQSCDLRTDLPYPYTLYTFEISPCLTPDQLAGRAAAVCQAMTTMTASEGIQFDSTSPGGNDGVVPICDLSQSCGDGECESLCENTASCPADCAVSTEAPQECAPGWLPPSGCTCCASTLVCADGSIGEFNPACTGGGDAGGQPPVCGDGVCGGGEACWSCSADCGPC